MLVALALGALAGGCQRKAKTPDQAWARFVAAVEAKDPARLYAALDLPTRWSWMSVRSDQREAYDIVLSNFPEGPTREQQLARFEAGALAESEAALFTAQLPAGTFDELARGLKEAKPPGDPGAATEVEVRGGDGRSWKLRKGDDGSWGYAGFSAEGEERKRRAAADLEVARNNAADLERAATRAGR